MNRSAIKQVLERPVDLIFVALLALCLLMAVAGIGAGIEKREALLTPGGARKVDLVKIKKQISDGALSPRKGLFYRKIRP
ncbi:MAG: hypothetical protein HY914_13615 [Desulfomonile tiedjei]|nr:hypothetical protein [Desulfomonile tiedjei]